MRYELVLHNKLTVTILFTVNIDTNPKIYKNELNPWLMQSLICWGVWSSWNLALQLSGKTTTGVVLIHESQEYIGNKWQNVDKPSITWRNSDSVGTAGDGLTSEEHVDGVQPNGGRDVLAAPVVRRDLAQLDWHCVLEPCRVEDYDFWHAPSCICNTTISLLTERSEVSVLVWSLNMA